MAALLLDEAAFQRIPAAKQSAFIYEWIDNVTKNLSKCTKAELKANQKTLVEQILRQLKQAPGAAIRQSLARCLASVFTVGDSLGLMETVNKLNDLIKSRDDSSDFQSTRLAAIEAMGRLFECVGRMVRRVNFNNYFQLECVGL
jgi:hypothetical protein